MVRVKNSVAAHARHKKVISRTKGYYGARSRAYRVAFQAMIKAGVYSYRDRRQKKRQFRQLWIIKINAAARENSMSYSSLINKLHESSIMMNRKVLADLAMFDQTTFSLLIKKIRSI
ncbi:50S ribosomal protein L20 [Blochmannia endosymbiont of Polyrhachis (Hedomyrma) turneri]|uniref:50S ribosomal protein L20 n=1 Tax=Blochmannia endosymbiont of Polyrhachis (Hedomyrma) turneri TaxID=1505596 RepID=UPI00061A7C4A|nr:50S ribosomal protein L20 [Blochmannia endosymbiont of Polyrhachis (Hedomyrma) turneri]AKC59920.1 50S ribosomal protein L20 [Blochmannia endosymbiont of Polyrhachis (Hedomyrma) turneri]